MTSLLRLCLILAFLGAFALPAAPQAADPAHESFSPEEWADAFFESALDAHRLNGAVVSVVRGGEIVLLKGYGTGDVVAGTAASPSNTRVRIGSTTKTFTATLIALLMQDGLIRSLDDPANDYLSRYQLPDNDGQPITLRHLLTHTAGFGDRFFFIGSTRNVDVPVSAKVFDSLRPDYVRPAGQRAVYSNFGVATLGLVVEDVTGMAIHEVMKERIFSPLDMQHTDLLVNIHEPAGLARPGVIGRDGQVLRPTRFTAINPGLAATGTIVSTAEDMAAYMLAQLGHGGHFDDTLRSRLHTRLFSNAGDISGLGMVFFIDEWAGRKTVAHGGNWAGFNTWMVLVPEEDIGLFVNLISDAPAPGMTARFRNALSPARPAGPAVFNSAAPVADSFLAAAFGPKRPAPEAMPGLLTDLDRYAGAYRSDRRPFSSAEAVSSLVYFGAEVLEVTAGENGLFLGGAGPWLPIGDGRFVLDGGHHPIIVIEPDPHTGRLILKPEIGIYTFSRIPGWAHPRLHAIIVHIALPLSLACLFSFAVLGRSYISACLMVAGSAALLAILAATTGLAEGRTLMNSFYEGNSLRLAVFVAAINLLALAAAAGLILALLRKHRQLAAFVFALPPILTAAILSAYGVVGYNLD